MAPSFARSISFPLSPSRSSNKPRMPRAGHARSVSLPCRSHPVLAHLHMHIRAWAQDPTSVASGLAHVDALSGATSSDRLLDAFLLLADAHGSFQEAVVELKQDVPTPSSATTSPALRSQRKAGKELVRLATAAREGARPSRLGFGCGNAAEVDVVGLLADDGTKI